MLPREQSCVVRQESRVEVKKKGREENRASQVTGETWGKSTGCVRDSDVTGLNASEVNDGELKPTCMVGIKVTEHEHVCKRM